MSCVVPNRFWQPALSVLVFPLWPWLLSAAASLEGRCRLWWGVVWGSPWVSFPACVFFCCPIFPVRVRGVLRGGGSCGRGFRFFRVVVLWWPLLPIPDVVPLATAPPPHFLQLCSPAGGPCCVRFPVVGCLPLPLRRSVLDCPGRSFFWPVGGCVAAVVRLLWLGSVIGLGAVFSRCPSGGSCGRSPRFHLAGGLSALVDSLRGFLVLWLSVLFPSTWLARLS